MPTPTPAPRHHIIRRDARGQETSVGSKFSQVGAERVAATLAALGTGRATYRVEERPS